MLTKCPAKRSNIEKICSHWWVNEGYEQNCLDIAEDLAAQTPVRLDLLLSLVPQSASADKLVVGDQRPTGEVVTNMSSETLVPTRCHSVGSLMELDRTNSDRRVREMVEEEPRAGSATSDSKRKLENTPSMDETAGLEAGAKRKERLRKKDKNDETRPHRFTSNRLFPIIFQYLSLFCVLYQYFSLFCIVFQYFSLISLFFNFFHYLSIFCIVFHYFSMFLIIFHYLAFTCDVLRYFSTRFIIYQYLHYFSLF